MIKAYEKERIEALWASVEHWLNNFHHPDDAEISAEFCPLCDLYYDWDDGEKCCIQCPVFQKTWQQECKGTPWKEVRKQQNRRRDLLAKANVDLSRDKDVIDFQQKQYLNSIKSMYVYVAGLAIKESQAMLFGSHDND